MHHHLTRLLLIPAFIFLTLDLSSQTFGDEDNLFIPPAIKVSVPHSDEEKPMIVVKRTEDPQWTALLPALFFDNPGDWMIPERYILFGSPAETREYADSNGVEEGSWGYSLPKYYEILNILGNRMLRYPAATLALRGCYSFEGGESAKVARERALVVREYLTNIWGVDTVRLPLLPVERRADTLSSNPIQAEGRRVDFVTETPELLEPVRFPQIGIRGEPTYLQIVLIPNMAPEKIDSIEIMMLDDMGDLQDSKMLPGERDSTSYTIHAVWEQEKSRGEEGMTLVVRLHSIDGKTRPSNKVFLPVHIQTDEAEEKSLGPTFLSAPFPDFRSADFGPYAKREVASAIDFFESGITPEEREGYVVLVSGQVDLAEHPSRDPVEVNVMTDGRRAAIDGVQAWSSSGKLSLKKLVPIDRDGETMWFYVNYTSEEESQSWQRTYEQKQRDFLDQRSERPYLADADSLANQRAERVALWLVDSLGVPMINEEMPDDVGVIGMASSSRYKEEEEQEVDVIHTTAAMKRGVGSSGEEGERIYMTPEARWYGRGVRLEFWTREYLKFRLKIAGLSGNGD